VTYRVVLSPLARKRLAALTPPTQRLIVDHLFALADDPRPPTTEPLTGELRGLRKLRVGDWRVLYEIDPSAGVVRVATIGHRRMVYREMRRRRR
jgi:mRNA interferase RelE/StbE